MVSVIHFGDAMELRQMEYFIAIADAGSISAAARKLHMSQPPLSLQMKNLEEELGTVLFTRDKKHISLTESGKIFYQRAAGILALTRSTVSELSDVKKKRSFHIGVTPTTVSLFSPVLHDFIEKYPNTHLEIYDDDTFTLVELFKNGVIDATFIRTPITLNGVDHIVIKKEKMMAVSNNELPKQLSLKDLLQYPLVIYRRYYDFIMHAFISHDLKPNIFCLCNDGRTSLEVIKQTESIALLPESMISFCENEHSVVIDEDDLETEILFVYDKNTKNILVNEFVQIINEKRNDL